ncbi:MAG: DUF296 domain-containing protein [Clostridia bacterium]|nr:DUF296 domain-containing protein [Clostridia bacterium]
MDFRKIGDTYYIRFDKGDEMVEGIKNICRKEGIVSAIYTGIGGCSSAEIQTFNPQKGSFETELFEGMLELVAFTGNVIAGEDGVRNHHTHALYAYVENGEHHVIGGHLKSSTVLYTAEIELRPVKGGAIHHELYPETGTHVWSFGSGDAAE